MAAGVGIGVEKSVARAVADNDEVGFVIVGLGDAGEEAFCRGLLWRKDVFDAPRGVE